MPDPIDETQYLTVREVAQILNRTPRTVQNLCSSGTIAGVILREGGPWKPYFLIPKSSLRDVPIRTRGRPKKIPTLPGQEKPPKPAPEDPEIGYRG